MTWFFDPRYKNQTKEVLYKMGRNRVANLDDIGWRILEELQKDPRISYREISRRVNLSCSSVLERIKRMEEDGIIAGYEVVLDTAKIGLMVRAVIRVKVKSLEDETQLLKSLPEDPFVLQYWLVAGDDDFIIEAAFPSMHEMNSFLVKLWKHGQSYSCIVIDKPALKKQIAQIAEKLRG